MKKSVVLVLILIAFYSYCYCARFSFAVFGDNRDGDEVFKQLLGTINQDPEIKFAVNTGDLTPKGAKEEYENYWDMCKQSKVKIYDTIGNHDLGFLNSGVKYFKQRYGETYYSVEYDDCRIIFLDNSRSKGLGRKQLNWLKKALETDKIKFVVMHKPLIDPTRYYPNYVMTPPEENESLNKRIVKSGVKYIIAGHVHGYGREIHDNMVYLVSGGAGAPLYLPAFGGGYYHYVKITVDGSNVTDEVVKIAND